MKKTLFIIFTFLSFVLVNAQNETIEPVKWSYEFSEENNDEIEIVFKAEVQEGWSIYSQFVEGDGPIPTSVNFENDNIQLINEKAEESGTHRTEAHDKMFDLQLIKYKNDLSLVQKVKSTKNLDTISGFIEYMSCTDEMCIFPEPYKFTINLKK